MKVPHLFLKLSVLLCAGSFSTSHASDGDSGMVATAHPLATEAAIEILKSGGNAVDAAVAAAFAIGVVEPDGSGIGGGGGMVIYLNDRKESYYINYYARASEHGSRAGYSGKKDIPTAKSICVPGTVAGLTLAQDKFGVLSLEEVLAPAIRYASEGFNIDPVLSILILDNIETIMTDEETMNIFCVDGFPRMEGDRIIQEELAKTLTIIAREGREGFYEGELAVSMVNGIKERGGVLTMNDFTSYEAEITCPLKGIYRGYNILSANVPQSGVCLIEALNILENFDFQNVPHFSESAKVLHLIAEVERYVFADRTAYLGDPQMNNIPVEGLISKEYAKERFLKINQEKLVPAEYGDVEKGNPYPFDNESSENAVEETELMVDGHTTHLSVVDKDGNCVSLSQTLGTFFGSGQTINGVLFNSVMSNFSYNNKNSPNLFKDGKQSRSSIMPTIILKDGKPFLVTGSPGAARIITTMIEVVMNIIDYKMDVNNANLAPRFFVRDYTDYLYMEAGIRPEVRTELEQMGHKIRLYEDIDLFFGGVQMILIDPEDGKYYGSADKRREGLATGY
jgi:gamma-glutamyltranspeptidase/glutathione hydrolase